ncbi:MAG: hypothetical protein LBS60_02530, partial [Deltaproteobacteria bacterium]|nr:hypothetical protein [Deltaproteobacteria bacterium]
VFSAFFRSISYHQRPKGEETFHAFVQLILLALGFEVGTELPGAVGRLDLCVKLSSEVYLIIELKYCPNKLKLKPKEEDKLLAAVAIEKLPKETVDMSLAAAARLRFKTAEIYQITSANPQKDLTKTEANHLLAQAAVTSLSEETINQVLAKTARDKLPEEEIEEIFQNATSQLASSEEEIDNDLTKAAQLALEVINTKDYHGVLELKAQEIIDLGLSVYGHGERIKVIFAPKSPKKES